MPTLAGPGCQTECRTAGPCWSLLVRRLGRVFCRGGGVSVGPNAKLLVPAGPVVGARVLPWRCGGALARKRSTTRARFLLRMRTRRRRPASSGVGAVAGSRSSSPDFMRTGASCGTKGTRVPGASSHSACSTTVRRGTPPNEKSRVGGHTTKKAIGEATSPIASCRRPWTARPRAAPAAAATARRAARRPSACRAATCARSARNRAPPRRRSRTSPDGPPDDRFG